MGKPRLLVVPYPAQGHVLPTMNLSRRLVNRGFKITFVITESFHSCLKDSQSKTGDCNGDIELVSISDLMAPDEGRNYPAGECVTIFNSIPTPLEKLIRAINEREEDKISCVIADASVGSAFLVARKLGIPKVGFLPFALGTLVLSLHIPKLIQDGIIDADGAPMGDEMIKISSAMPEMNPAHLVFNCFTDPEERRTMFDFSLANSRSVVEQPEWLLCNSFTEIEPWAFDLLPRALPIGPLISETDAGDSPGLFPVDDSTCSEWLDQHPDSSVVYAAFGSTSVFNQAQFQELALGLELTGRPFLWVVRPDLLGGGSGVVYPDGFEARVGRRGKLVSWAPQQSVLRHPSVACFVSHCGWNSTMEGLSNGVPFVCLPYIADQFINRSYICDVWKVGLGVKADDNGVVTKEMVKETVELLLSDPMIKIRAAEMKQQARRSVREGGNSFVKFNGFVDELLGRS